MSFQTDFIKKLERKMHEEIAKNFDSTPFKPLAEWRQYDELLLTRAKPLPKIFEPTGEKIQMRRPAPYESR